MRRQRRGPVAALVAALALALSACAGLPTSGPVFAGLEPGAVAPPDFSFVPVKPQDGATPEQIVQGFIDAGIGPGGNWAVAQLYLAPSFRDQWKPNANTTVDERAARAYVSTGADKVTLTVTQEATVDATGAYQRSDGGQTTLGFTLAKVGGQWRITHAPDGVVLGADQFTSVFHEYPLMFFDPTHRFLVPDVRWFPSGNAATRIAKSLVDGKPTSWLASAVVSDFPDGVLLDPPSVPVVAGLARVSLSGPVLSLESQTLDRMQTQLQQSLLSAGATDVAMLYAGAQLNAQPVTTASTRIDARPLILTDKGFGFMSAPGALEAVPGVGDAVAKLQPTSIDLSADYTAAAVRTAGGAVLRVGADGSTTLLDTRAGLVEPAIDPSGYIWSVPADDPRAVAVYGPDGKQVAVTAGAWANASEVTSISVSRDGTRMAATLTVGGQHVVAVFGITRDAQGVPHAVGDAVPSAVLPGTGVDITWLDDGVLGILAHSGAGMVAIRQIVGGPGTSTPAPDQATTISGTTATTVRLRGADGTLYTQRGSNWEQAATGVLVLAGVQGTPLAHG